MESPPTTREEAHALIADIIIRARKRRLQAEADSKSSEGDESPGNPPR